MPTLPFIEIKLGLQSEHPLTPSSHSCFKVKVPASVSPLSAQPRRRRRRNHRKVSKSQLKFLLLGREFSCLHLLLHRITSEEPS
ncbi:hypothetical protein AHAS_Ahas20G0134700 [Arachis hypogaea]